ncbi:DUF350 domain-containing protein [Tamlana sp. I1]|uniref:DUF350 domain-containing protein n=1 Tax=Tamlana sp. I1 TaxID=2762061 RepID=UPI0018906033|nr:DUF350 domain-containing protein [Tamlana sp. I1]
MEENTLIWIGNTFFYIFLFFILFFISKQLFLNRFKKIDVNNELTTKDNVAFSILTTGYYAGILIIFLGVIQGDSYGYLIDTFLVIIYGIIGNLLLLVSSVINEKIVFTKKFSLFKEIVRDENRGAGAIEFANFIGSSLIIYGAITGKSTNFFPELSNIGLFISGLISLIVFWSIGQFILLVFFKIYPSFSKYEIFKQIEKDNNAVGVVYASIFISIAFLYAQAIKGDIISWLLTIENIVYYLGLGFILLPISRWVVDKIILPKSDLTHEIVHQEIPNQGAAFIEAFAYIGSAVLISFCI